MVDGDEADRRPRRRRKDARPAELVEAGLKEFAEKGFAATRMEDVARRAGVAKGTIYRYFEDKEALFMAAVRSRVTPVFTDVDGFLDAFPGTTRQLIEMLLGAVYNRLVDSDLRVLMRIVIAESGNFPQLAELYHRETVSVGRRMLDRIIARGIARGEVRPGPAADLPLVIVAPMVMAVMWKLTFDRFESIPVERFLEAHLDLLFGGVLTGGPAPGAGPAAD